MSRYCLGCSGSSFQECLKCCRSTAVMGARRSAIGQNRCIASPPGLCGVSTKRAVFVGLRVVCQRFTLNTLLELCWTNISCLIYPLCKYNPLSVNKVLLRVTYKWGSCRCLLVPRNYEPLGHVRCAEKAGFGHFSSFWSILCCSFTINQVSWSIKLIFLSTL